MGRYENDHKINQTTKTEINRREETEPALLSQTCNNFLSKIAQNIGSKLVHSSNNYTDYLTEPSENSFILTLKA